LDEVAILTRPGAPSRQPEPAYIEPALADRRRLDRIQAPGTLEGGDVLRVGSALFVGVSTRTNAEGIRQLERIGQPLSYTVTPVRVSGSLHLKTACTALDAQTILLNPNWIDPEPFGANVLPIPASLIVNEAFPRTLALLTLPKRGCSGDACGAPLRSRLRGLPGPTARFLVRRAGASSRRTESFFSHTGEQLERRDRALPLPQGRGLRADGKRSPDIATPAASS
jgi:hypothetical protein